MTAEDRRIRSICVVGGGVVALSAAIAFSRALPRVRVSILETAVDPAALADQPVATLPTIHRFHAAIGFDELELVRSRLATHLLGTRMEHWSASGEPWYHAFGDYGIPAGEAAFHNIWAAAKRGGRSSPFHRSSAGAVLGEAGKFVHPANDPHSPFANFLYAFRLDPVRYQERLKTAAAGVARETGELRGIQRNADGGIAALLLTNDLKVEADLFLDCSGPAALLASQLDREFEDWRAWLPCDRMARLDEPARELVPLDTVSATDFGWVQRSPLPDRTLITQLSSSAHDTAGAAGSAVAIACGRRSTPWTHNVLALGDAATMVDPLHGTNLHLAHSAILRALELLPGRDCHPLELREYNRRTEQETTRVRDFLALQYLRSGKRNSPFWRMLAERELPETLHRTVEQFERRGRLPLFEEEIFDKHSWAAAFIGLGIMPREVDAVAAGVDQARASEAMAALEARIAALVARVPPYTEVLARMQATPAR